MDISRKIFRYNYTVRDDEGELFLHFPKLPEIVFSLGSDSLGKDDIHQLALNAARNAIQTRIDFSDEIPEPDEPQPHIMEAPKQTVSTVKLNPIEALKVVIYEESKSQGYTKSSLAEILQTTHTHVTRLLNIFHHSRYDIIESAFTKLNLNVDVEVSVKTKNLT